VARNTQLITLLDMLRSEARLSSNPAHNLSVVDSQVLMIQRLHDWLVEDYDWPHLRVDVIIPLQEGQRFYEIPEEIDIERLEAVSILCDGRFKPLSPNITDAHLSIHNSELEHQDYPPEAFKDRGTGLFEIWPISDRDGTAEEGKLRLTGIKKSVRLIKDTDRSLVDDRLLILYAAAEVLAASGAKDTGYKLEQARKRYEALKGNASKIKKFTLGGMNTVGTTR
jgi:hypothetical protein